ncbi:hypothetical protein HMPREF1979_00068 [Actinomyces johnsonii F0542]|uniref:Uncharacterized protein n=1 Tax=Actinomyces johnsonii F0542 TaxID=1321818 RepID=U1QWQ7_9ACTO|nr:hypothetical protein HMPREF1979_00068 [Actinomyces johnsonii F0542]
MWNTEFIQVLQITLPDLHRMARHVVHEIQLYIIESALLKFTNNTVAVISRMG